MDPFLAISRREVVELAQPWDPERVVMDYVEEVSDASVQALSADDLKELEHGANVRYDLEHSIMGRIQAEMRLVVLNPERLDVSIDGAWWLSWWLRILALPFRRRLRRWLESRVDELLADLSAEPADDGEIEPQPLGDREREGDPRLRWTLEILTPEGRRIYRRTSPSRDSLP
ncbi:MAG TPA: hypothetical protein VIT43_15470 [Candidatus Dormibacteraeota bacterium]